ncbi:MAG: sulfide/dihydroorotate dehydrogenase-like FAD/NAD-binding protein [Candidatus Omnitrophica bacterium]|nr:sulfide/dihydroorotate dehydrogenase-like FAD/NAD-binding protein [Candidatus Omnitrophota bacterium]
MNKIIENLQLSDETFRMKVHAPLIAEERKAGQFIILQVHEKGERIPLTIVDSDEKEGSITLIFQAIGKTTHLLANLGEGDSIAHLVGPLGNPTHIENFGKVICVGGGIGTAPLYPIAKSLKGAGNKIYSIIGARRKGLVILEKEMKEISEELIITTDDGSCGLKGLVTEPLRELSQKTPKPDLVIAIGPAIMMKACCEVTKEFNIPTLVSLNTIMIDGTGMCGGCRVNVGSEVKFVCVDGPEFDGHKVDFDNMIKRLAAYKKFEDDEHHRCHMKLGIK